MIPWQYLFWLAFLGLVAAGCVAIWRQVVRVEEEIDDVFPGWRCDNPGPRDD